VKTFSCESCAESGWAGRGWATRTVSCNDLVSIAIRHSRRQIAKNHDGAEMRVLKCGPAELLDGAAGSNPLVLTFPQP